MEWKPVGVDGSKNVQNARETKQPKHGEEGDMVYICGEEGDMVHICGEGDMVYICGEEGGGTDMVYICDEEGGGMDMVYICGEERWYGHGLYLW